MSICLIIAAVLFALAAFGVAAGRINLIAAGLFFCVIAQLGGIYLRVG